jgi:hypothetical protein
MSFCLSTLVVYLYIGLKLSTNIIILSVLLCFVLNNLLFTYATEKHSKIVVVCESEDGTCCMQMDEDVEMCCHMEDCAARVPIQSAHANFSVIIGLDKDQNQTIQTPELSNFNLAQIHKAAELSEGHLNALIKPPLRSPKLV